MKRFLAFVFGWCMIAAAFLLSLQLCAFNRNFYASFYEKNDLAQSIGTDTETVRAGMDAMLDYLEGKRDDLDEMIVLNGTTREMFHENEISHMQDVRTLYQFALNVLAGAHLIGGLIFLWFLAFLRQNALRYLCVGMRDAGLCFLIVLAFLGLWAATDFTDFWTHFHQLFFSNDLWLLNPATDFMIMICPESLFISLVWRIILCFLVIFVPMELFAVLYSLRKV